MFFHLLPKGLMWYFYQQLTVIESVAFLRYTTRPWKMTKDRLTLTFPSCALTCAPHIQVCQYLARTVMWVEDYKRLLCPALPIIIICGTKVIVSTCD